MTLKGTTGLLFEADEDINIRSRGDFTAKHSQVAFTVEGSAPVTSTRSRPGIQMNANAASTPLVINSAGGTIGITGRDAQMIGSTAQFQAGADTTLKAIGTSLDPIFVAKGNGLNIKSVTNAVTLACAATKCDAEFIAGEDINFGGQNTVLNNGALAVVKTVFEATSEIHVDALFQAQPQLSAAIYGKQGVSFDSSTTTNPPTIQGETLTVSAGTQNTEGNVHFHGEDIKLSGTAAVIHSGDQILSESPKLTVVSENAMTIVAENAGVAFFAIGPRDADSDLTITTSGTLTLNAFRGFIHQDHAKLSFFGKAAADRQNLSKIAAVQLTSNNAANNCQCTGGGNCNCPVHSEQLQDMMEAMVAYGIFTIS